MTRLIFLFLFTGCLTACAQDFVHSSTFTLGVGGLPYSDNPYYPTLQTGGPTFAGSYEYRIWKYLAAEAGTDILLPSGQSYVQSASIAAGQNEFPLTSCITNCTTLVSERSSVALLTYGLKGIFPLAGNRLELFAGIGGAYGWNSEFSGSLNSAFAQASLGGRLAIDRGHRFWLGTTLRGFTSFGPGRQAWVPLTFDFGIRFGHR